MDKIVLTSFGKTIKKKLVDMERSHAWLIEKVSECTGLYFDRSYLHKIMTGKLDTPKVVQTIKEILEISDAPEAREGN